MNGITNTQLARLLHQCAQAMNHEDERQLNAGEAHSCTSGPTARGREICEEICSGPFGEIVYYLLAYTWNDALDWADRQITQQEAENAKLDQTSNS